MEANWNAAYTTPVQIAFPAGAGFAALAEILAVISPHCAMMLGTYTMKSPTTINTDNVDATLRTKFYDNGKSYKDVRLDY